MASVHVLPESPYRFENTVVRVRVDPSRCTVFGDETAIVQTKAAGLRALPFYSGDIHYRYISVNGRVAQFSQDPARETVAVTVPAGVGNRFSVRFVYSARPQRGLFCMQPDRGYPRLTPEVWTQGETNDNRYWFPTWDEPNEKTPSELVITVPRGWSAIGNGYLRSHTTAASTETWDWNSPHPKSTYLIAFAAGPFAKLHTQSRHLAVDAFVRPSLASDSVSCFGNTAQMVDYFGDLLGVPLPWEKYDQIAVERFTYGGMENASATILADQYLHPANTDVEKSCDAVVSHELAEQWFGDDVTMNDWANCWLGEGFATYLEQLWDQKRFGTVDFEYDRYLGQQRYYAEDAAYHRPIVDNEYHIPLDLFDSSSHERAAAVLHGLRAMLGDRTFFRILHTYLEKYRYGRADTHQFFAIAESVSGTSLGWFEEQWFFRPGYPHLRIAQHYDAVHHTVGLKIVQKNIDGLPYRLPVEIEVWVDGRVHTAHPVIARNDETVVIPGVDATPQMVLFDPDGLLLHDVEFTKTPGELAFQATRAPHVIDREWALAQLSHAARSSAGAAAIALVARRDPSYGVRADAVAIAATHGDGATVEALFRDPDARVRIAAIEATENLHSPGRAVVSRVRAFSEDKDPLIAGSALTALGTIDPRASYSRLAAALQRPSYGSAVASGALAGLAKTGRRDALRLIEGHMTYGTPDQERAAAITAYAELARALKLDGAKDRLQSIALNDPLVSSRMAAVRALGTLGNPSAIPVLAQIQARDPQWVVQDAAYAALITLRQAR